MAVPADEIHRRIAAVQAALADADLDAGLFVEATDIVYLTGVMADAHVLVPVDGPPIVLVRRGLERMQADTPHVDVRPLASLRELVPLVPAGSRLGVELDVLPAGQYLRYVGLFEGAHLADASAALAGVRAVKSAWEVEQSRSAARQLEEAFRAAPALVADAVTDREIQIELEAVLRRAGHQGPLRFRGLNGQMFYGAVLAGPDGAIAPWADTPLGGPGPNSAVAKGPGGWSIRPGDAVTVDLVGACEGYLADATRTFFRGAPQPRLAEALEVCERILTALEELMHPGTPASALYDRGLELADEAGFGDHWMGHGPARVRFVGHGIGLEINERPFLAHGFDAPLAEGNVIAVEPKLVFPGVGAVGVEDSYVIGPDGPSRITPADPRRP